jgi:hypothetical protein
MRRILSIGPFMDRQTHQTPQSAGGYWLNNLPKALRIS